MRIFQVITLSELGGAQSVVANLANEQSSDNEVFVIAGEGDGKLYDMLDAKITRKNIPTLVRHISPIKEIRTIVALRRLYRKYHPDIIHLHSSKAGLLGRVAFPKSKVVYTVHGFDSIRTAYRKFLPLERALQNRCQAIVGVSKYDETNLHEERISRNVSTVYNGIAQPKPLMEDPFTAYRDYKGIILCIARFFPPKKTDMFIEVASRLNDYAFLWIGNQAEVTDKHSGNTFFLGNLPNAGAYCRFADLFWLPSDYEGLPIVILEAFANGTPVVASAVGGIPEILDNNNGIAVENDVEKMAHTIDSLMKDPHRRDKMSLAARKSYENHFAIAKMANGYHKIYERIYQKNNPVKV